jgi:hypothetical protein
MKKIFLTTVIIACIVTLGSFVYGQEKAAPTADELAKKLSNPIANMISLPFQFNFQFNINGRETSENGYKMMMNIQPVIPVSLGSKLNLISRIIIPVVVQRDVTGNDQEQNGLGDIVYSGWLSPAVSKVVWGVGPCLSIPTATNASLGSKKLAVGPTVIILGQPGKWTVGMLANQLWSVAGNKDRADFSSLFIQPFVSYGFSGGLTLGVSSENSYEWKSAQLKSGLVALNLSQVFKFGGKQIASLGLSPMMFYSDARVQKPDWGARMSLTLIFAKK